MQGTRQFSHLHKVFTNIPSNTPQCGTVAWTQIFLHYPLAGVVLAHKLLARGLKACLKFKDDSAAGCAHIESVNTSVSQLSNLPHLSVPDVFALKLVSVLATVPCYLIHLVPISNNFLPRTDSIGSESHC